MMGIDRTGEREKYYNVESCGVIIGLGAVYVLVKTTCQITSNTINHLVRLLSLAQPNNKARTVLDQLNGARAIIIYRRYL